jgi:hypothetical protein
MNSEQAANILAFYSYYHPNESVDDIALDFKIPAALIVNALYYGDRIGLFTTKKKGPQFKEIVVQAVPDDNSDFGKDMDRVKENILEVITNINSDGEDITDDNLFIWLGVPFIVAKTALQLLINEGNLAKYWIIDPKDKSKYHFYTLSENKEKRYGHKQFKRTKGKSKNVKLSRRKR